MASPRARVLGRRRWVAVVAFHLVLAFAQLSARHGGVEAHTWLRSKSRASREASTTVPWRARKETDTHAQVGPGQYIILKWAAAHVGWYCKGRPLTRVSFASVLLFAQVEAAA